MQTWICFIFATFKQTWANPTFRSVLRIQSRIVLKLKTTSLYSYWAHTTIFFLQSHDLPFWNKVKTKAVQMQHTMTSLVPDCQYTSRSWWSTTCSNSTRWVTVCEENSLQGWNRNGSMHPRDQKAKTLDIIPPNLVSLLWAIGKVH